MMYDKTRIVIREREPGDLFDLALRVLQGEFGGLFAWSFAGILPCAWLTHVYLSSSLRWIEGGDWAEFEFGWHAWIMALWLAPLATAPISLYLGQALFVERPPTLDLLKTLAIRLPQLIWYQLLWRGFFAIIILFLLPLDVRDPIKSLLEFLLLASWFLSYLLWPYSNEVLLLERHPYWPRKGRASTWSRTIALHRRDTGRAATAWLLNLFIGGCLLMSLTFASQTLVATILLATELTSSTRLILFEWALWSVLLFFTVVRYLGYLDLRIRLEGWELELQLRSEGARLARQVT